MFSFSCLGCLAFGRWFCPFVSSVLLLGSFLYTSCVCIGTFVWVSFSIYLLFIDQKKKKKQFGIHASQQRPVFCLGSLVGKGLDNGPTEEKGVDTSIVGAPSVERRRRVWTICFCTITETHELWTVVFAIF